MGHSLGGATAVSVGRRDDISAVIDLDGTTLGEELSVTDEGILKVNEEPYGNPLLSIDNDEHHSQRLESKKKGEIYPNNVIIDNALQGFETYFKGSGHMNFTDFPIFAPTLANKNLLYIPSGLNAFEVSDRLKSFKLYLLYSL